jgi:hypothetical protein
MGGAEGPPSGVPNGKPIDGTLGNRSRGATGAWVAGWKGKPVTFTAGGAGEFGVTEGGGAATVVVMTPADTPGMLGVTVIV